MLEWEPSSDFIISSDEFRGKLEPLGLPMNYLYLYLSLDLWDLFYPMSKPEGEEEKKFWFDNEGS